ncbi:MAG: hypothetical protein QOF76_2850 [Solirubrobacteraceae bacterium]|jgi:hypothetical protein|nr:hypothetical protein [Solirubrobacteraceae bacterium]
MTNGMDASTARLATLLMVSTALVALLTSQPGLDYFADCGAVDALVRRDLGSFFAQQPLMGPVSVVLRAVFVAPVFHASITTVYLVGVIPCYGALLALAFVLRRQMVDRPAAERRLVVLLCAGSPLVVKAYHWGHPEELLATAFCIGAMLAAGRDRARTAGVLFGLAVATKQWAVLAGAPILLTLPSRRVAFLLTGGAVVAALLVPMLLGDPDRFWLVQRAAGSADPSKVLGNTGAPDTRVLPHSLWLPFTEPVTWDHRSYRISGSPLAFRAHFLILLCGMAPLLLLWSRRRSHVTLATGLRLLALLLLARCVLDPNDLDYYHVPLVAALAALGAVSGPRELRVALLATAALGVAFVLPADSLSAQAQHGAVKWLLYMLAVVPLGAWLSRDLVRALGPARASVVSPGEMLIAAGSHADTSA